MNYGPVWVDLQGTGITPDEHAIIRHKNTGGVILFSKNYSSKDQITDLVQSIRDVAAKDLLIGVDHEGGRIWRFGDDFTRPPTAEYFGKLYRQEPDQALQELNAAGQTIAAELVACGIDLTFAPVLDINHGVSEVIGDRSYGSEPQVVTACARAFIAGMRAQGMGSVGKHFPGHGGCAMDSHFTNAVDTRDYALIATTDIVPFVNLYKELTAIMPAHVVYPEVDKFSTCFSKFWLQETLRNKIGFAGAIISDCLSMQGSGFAKDMIEGAELALNAGCDMVIASQQTREYLLSVLDAIKWQMTTDQMQRIDDLAVDFATVS